jgi:NAD+-dependent protein deacetylase SIR2
MEALSSKIATGKRKRVQKALSPTEVDGLHSDKRSATLATKDESHSIHNSLRICHDQHQLLCRQYPADLDIALPSGNTRGSQSEIETFVTKLAEDDSCRDKAPTLTDFHRDPDPGYLQDRTPKKDEICTYEQALAARYLPREIGLERFVQEFVLQDRIPLQTLCAAFGVPSPADGSDPPSSALISRLKKAIAVDMGNRIKLHKYNSVNDAVALLRDAKNIMVITGAGISTSLEIPDFRSRGGLYSTIRAMGFDDPESVFSRDTFEQDPRPFFSVASMILPPTDGRITPAHAFLRLLQDKGKLLTLYTQNVDGIDRTAGMRMDKLIQLHGSFDTATCISCDHCVKGEEIIPQIRNGEVPNCAECAKARQIRNDQVTALRSQNGRSVRRKTQDSSSGSMTEPAGIMRPDIVFMGEPPKPYLKRFKRDCAKVDLLLVMGTSLPVEPVSTMPNRIPPKVPQIYIGRTEMYPERFKRIDFDIQLLGECDVVAEMLAKGCSWDLEHEMIPEDSVIAVEPWGSGRRHCHEIRRQTKAPRVEGVKLEPGK